MWDWKELLPLAALGAGALVAIICWLLVRRPIVLSDPAWSEAISPAQPEPVVLEGTLLGNMLAVTVVSGGERDIELPGPIWEFHVGMLRYLAKLMVAVGDRLDEWNVADLDRDPLSAAQPASELRQGIFDDVGRGAILGITDTYPPRPVRRHPLRPPLPPLPRYRLTPTTAWVVAGVTTNEAEKVVSAMQQRLNEAQ